jgi:F-type H+-transporting ATPase subunit b
MRFRSGRSKSLAFAVLTVCWLLPVAAWASPEAEGHNSPGVAGSHDKPAAHTSTAHAPGRTAHAPAGHAAGKPHINWTDFNAPKSGGNQPLIAPLINFAILVFVLVLFLRKPLSLYLSDRHIKIKDDLAAAARLREEAQQQLNSIDSKLDGLDKEIAEIKEAVAKDAEQEKERILAAAKRDANALVAGAERTLNVEIERAKRKLEVMAIQAALESADKLLRKAMKQQDFDRLREEYFEQIQKTGSSVMPGGGN